MLGFICAAMLAAIETGEVPQRHQTARDAFSLAVGHCLALPPEERPWYRYVWVPPHIDRAKAYAASSFAMNSIGTATAIVSPVVIDGGSVLAWDARRVFPATSTHPDRTAKFLARWDGLSVQDPYFHVNKSLFQSGLSGEKVEQNTPIAAPYLDPEKVAILANEQLSGSLIYRVDWLNRKLLSTIDGGQYYEFTQIEPTEGQTDQQAWFAAVGAEEALSKSLNADQRVAIMISKVTGSPRRIDRYQGAIDQIFITRDVPFTADSSQIQKNPLANLLSFDDDQREFFAIKRNGLVYGALFADNQKLVDEVPINTATHRGRQLVPLISCVDCHAANEFFIPAQNDVMAIWRGGLDTVDDIGDTNRTRDEVLDRLATLYAGDLSTRFAQARMSVNAACRNIVAPIRDIREGEQTYAQAVMRATSDIHFDYRDSLIDGRRAAIELGYQVDDKKSSSEVFAEICPRVAEAEDVSIEALRAGLSLRRFDFERIWIDLMFRTGSTSE